VTIKVAGGRVIAVALLIASTARAARADAGLVIGSRIGDASEPPR
jgi:hypothetical protein